MLLLMLMLRLVPGQCNSQSMRAALLRGMKEALASSRKLLSKKYDNCVVVGNSGGAEPMLPPSREQQRLSTLAPL